MTTIREVADRAGVSTSTISRVLNDKASDLVSTATRERVEEVARELGYQPSAAARAMVTGRTFVVAIACEEVTFSHYARMIEAARTMANRRGYHLLLASEGKGGMGAIPSLLGQRQADIVVRVAYPVEEVDDYADRVSGPNQTLVALGPVGEAPPLEVTSAYWDDRLGIHKAVAHLTELGHRRITFLAGSAARYKQRAFDAAAAELGVEGSSLNLPDDDQLQAGALMAREAVSATPRPTALLARNDQFAIGAMSALAEAGLSVPDDMSLMGYNDIPTAAFIVPSLTTVRTPVVECAEAVLTSAFDSLEESAPPEATEIRSFSFDTQLVVRGSTGPPTVDQRR